MKAKLKRVQSNQAQPNPIDLSSLPSSILKIYIYGCMGSLVSTISNQSLLPPKFVIETIENYISSFEPDNYLIYARADKKSFDELCHKFIKGEYKEN